MLFLHELNFCFNVKGRRRITYIFKKNSLVASIFKCEKRSWGQNIWEPLRLSVFTLHSFPHFLGFLGFGFYWDFLVVGSVFQSELPLYSLVILSNPPTTQFANSCYRFLSKQLQFKIFITFSKLYFKNCQLR